MAGVKLAAKLCHNLCFQQHNQDTCTQCTVQDMYVNAPNIGGNLENAWQLPCGAKVNAKLRGSDGAQTKGVTRLTNDGIQECCRK
eukprot:1157214-Pelagomonas_calceolata.AAC.9